jgi:hypothetical protein
MIYYVITKLSDEYSAKGVMVPVTQSTLFETREKAAMWALKKSLYVIDEGDQNKLRLKDGYAINSLELKGCYSNCG